MDIEGLFRRRLKQLIEQKYRSLDQLYLEADFSKGHLSEILRGKGSPTLATVVKIAKALEIEVRELFVFPERGHRDRAMELLQKAKPDAVRRVLRILTEDAEGR